MVDDILDPNRTSLPVVKGDLTSLALVNKVGAQWRAFPTSMIFPQSFAFHDQGPHMVGDAHPKTIATLGFFEGQRRFVLGQAIDLNTMMCTVDLCLALARHRGDQLLSVGADDSSKGHNGPHSWRGKSRPWLDKPKNLSI